MTLFDWYKFNEPALMQNDLIFTIYRAGSYYKDDIILPHTLMAIDNAIMLFGALELKHFRTTLIQNQGKDYYTIECLLWFKEGQEENDIHS